MKILWIVNSVLDYLSVKLYGKNSNGVWMDALLSEFKEKEGYELAVVTTVRGKNLQKFTDNNITYYALSGGNPFEYKENKKENVLEWTSIINDEKPDLVQVWGTEFTHGLCALRILSKRRIPSVIYMQGYLGSIARFYQAGIPYKELKKTITLRDFIKRDSILQQQKKYYCSSKKEAEMLKLSGAIISENEWCDANIRSIVPDIKTYHCPLSINKVFSSCRWDIDNVERHSIICTASGYTIKGLHILLRAIALLKSEYTNIKLYVPGTPQVAGKSFKAKLKKNGYTKYIEKLIKELSLQDNIVWLNYISQEELAERYAKTHVFVMPSSIENHSSSLKEAMIVGVPSVSSYVGGIPEYVKHGENGLLYRFEEYEVLANNIKTIFNDDGFAKTLSENAKNSMQALHNGEDLFNRITEIYESILQEK